MTTAWNEVEIFRSVLADEAESRAGAHPGLDHLIGYSEGSLGNAAEEQVRDHLAGCRGCAKLMLEVEPLMRPDEAPAAGVAELEIKAAWSRFQGLVATAEQPGAVAVVRLRWAPALAASLAVATLALGLWSLRLRHANESLRQQLGAASRPSVNMPVAYLEGARRSASVAEYRLNVPGPSFALFFGMAGAEAADEFEVRLLGSQGAEVLRQGGLVMSELGGLRLGLTRGLVPAGEYRVLLWARRADEWREVEEYRLTVTYR